MPFYPPSWVPSLPEIPNVPLQDFILNEKYGRLRFASSRDPFVCGLSGKSYSIETVRQRVDFIARALARTLGFEVNKGSEWDKVVAIYSLNAIDYFPVCWAVLKMGGIVTTMNAGYTASELERSLKHTGAKALFTCDGLLRTSEEACDKVGIGRDRMFTMPVSGDVSSSKSASYRRIDDLISAGAEFPPLEHIKWNTGESARRIAFLQFSSGTSGLPKAVMLTHRNFMASVLQSTGYELKERNEIAKASGSEVYTESCLGVAPMGHILGASIIAHSSIYRGDSVVVLPRYHLETMLQTIERHKIAKLYVVPPMIVDILRSASLCQKYDLTSVLWLLCGGSPLKEETCQQLAALFPKWILQQGYGSTEGTGGITLTSPSDVSFGRCGSLLAENSFRIMTSEGEEIKQHDCRGELFLRGPGVFAGYLHNDKANQETFVQFEDGVYMRTGDQAMIQLSPKGNEQLVITERLKELIKVKGHQVAPADLEAHLLTHPKVDDCAVIGIPIEREGEIPKAFIVKSSAGENQEEKALEQELFDFVEQHKASHMRLRGGIEFVDSVPKSPSGKILRRLLRDQEIEKQGSKARL